MTEEALAPPQVGQPCLHISSKENHEMGKKGYGSSRMVRRNPKGYAKRLRRQEEQWARRSGQVVTYKKGEKPDLPPPSVSK
jgi:hypothetical protein